MTFIIAQIERQETDIFDDLGLNIKRVFITFLLIWSSLFCYVKRRSSSHEINDVQFSPPATEKYCHVNLFPLAIKKVAWSFLSLLMFQHKMREEEKKRGTRYRWIGVFSARCLISFSRESSLILYFRMIHCLFHTRVISRFSFFIEMIFPPAVRDCTVFSLMDCWWLISNVIHP